MIIEAIQTFFAGATAIALLAFSCLTLGGSAVGLAVSTPLFVLFSPILVPATIAATVLASGFTASGSFVTTAIKIFLWLYKKYTGKDPPKIPGMPAAPGKPAEPKKDEKKEE